VNPKNLLLSAGAAAALAQLGPTTTDAVISLVVFVVVILVVVILVVLFGVYPEDVDVFLVSQGATQHGEQGGIGALGLQHRIGRRDGLVARGRLAPHDHQQIGRRRLRVDRQIGIVQLRQVRRGGHQAGRLRDAVALAQLGAQLHQRDRILVEIREHLEARGRHVHEASALAGAGNQANSPANKPSTVSAPDVAPTASARCSAGSTTSPLSSQSNAWRRRISGSV